MYYCDMGPDGAEIRNARFKPRTVGRYLIYQGEHPPGQLVYKAHTVATLDANGDLVWHKHRNRSEIALLTEEEQKELMLQILKSETW
jgi:hypothetical protein